MQNGMGNGSSTMNGGGMSPDTWKMRNSQGISRFGVMGDSMQGGDSEKRRAKKEYRAKMKRYKAKHNEAKAVFERIAGKAPETRMEAEEIYAEILKRGSVMEKAKAPAKEGGAA